MRGSALPGGHHSIRAGKGLFFGKERKFNREMPIKKSPLGFWQRMEVPAQNPEFLRGALASDLEGGHHCHTQTGDIIVY